MVSGNTNRRISRRFSFVHFLDTIFAYLLRLYRFPIFGRRPTIVIVRRFSRNVFVFVLKPEFDVQFPEQCTFKTRRDIAVFIDQSTVQETFR